MTWALEQRIVKDASARHVLLCLANYADKMGRNAFPSVASLVEDTGLAVRTVRYKLEQLHALGAIRLGNQAVAASYIDRIDRRPVVYDLAMTRGATVAPRKERAGAVIAGNNGQNTGYDGENLPAGQPEASDGYERGANDAPREGAENNEAGCSACTSLGCTGCNLQPNGVQMTTERGATVAPNPSLNHQGTVEQHARMDAWQRFAMFEAWLPAAAELAPFLRLAMLPAEFSVDHQNAFIAHYLALPAVVENSAGWCKRLAKWLKDEHTRNLGAPNANSPTRGRAAAAGPSVAENITDTEWAEGLDPV